MSEPKTVHQRIVGFVKYSGIPVYISILCVIAFISILGYIAVHDCSQRLQRKAAQHQDSLELINIISHTGMEVTIRTTTYLATGIDPAHETMRDTWVDGKQVMKLPTFSICLLDSTRADAFLSYETAIRQEDTVIVTKSYGSISFSKSLGAWRRR